MSSIADLIKKQYEKGSSEESKPKKELKNRKSIVETVNMKRISLWLDKDTYNIIQQLIYTLKKDQMALAYANESNLIRNSIKKGFPLLISDFQKMFPNLNFKEIV
ncbi:MAG: hypothetical protein ACFFFT_17395 [Candidatus Thorarchaeota archaeon]